MPSRPSPEKCVPSLADARRDRSHFSTSPQGEVTPRHVQRQASPPLSTRKFSNSGRAAIPLLGERSKNARRTLIGMGNHFARVFRVRGIALLSAFLSTTVAHAQPVPTSPIVKAELLVDAPIIKKGEPIAAGVRFTMPDEWHIYWKNPGDSGLETRLDWTLPDGLTASEIEWPAPERIEISGLVNYGYSHEVTLPVALTPSQDGVNEDVKVKASWLVCREICIPESAELSALLKGDTRAAEKIAEARAKVPQTFTGTATYRADASNVTLTITRDNPWNITSARFSPLEDGVIANTPAAEVKHAGSELSLTFKRGNTDLVNPWHGVLHVTSDGKESAYEISAAGEGVHSTTDHQEARSSDSLTNDESASITSTSKAPLLTSLFLAFLGGLILNIMPCVLPILALKALALSKKAAASRAAAAKQGISYTAGVVVSFLVIAAIMLALKSGGAAIGWGFQLQNPLFVGFLALVMLTVAANLFGLFELPVLFGEKATGIDDEKLHGSFLTGALAVLVATPCTAPFMATAIGATLALPTAQALSVFAALGLGMASPFLLISLWPAARRLIPKPGRWMHRFKQFLALPMLATAIWLGWVLLQILNPTPVATSGLYEPYSETRLAELRAEKKPVLVDATAAWCITCKINERVALKPDDMQQFFREQNVTLMVADWTNSDPEITAYLAGFGRNGVPLYVYYAPNAEPVVLPQVLTPALVKESIDQTLRK